jgi:hypothetical protein
VVLGVVNGVDTDGVDTKILEVLDIATEALSVQKRIFGIRGAT